LDKGMLRFVGWAQPKFWVVYSGFNPRLFINRARISYFILTQDFMKRRNQLHCYSVRFRRCYRI